jgi:hypothetical protein
MARKREKPLFEADPVPLHIHKRVSTQAILLMLGRKEVQLSFFANPKLEYHQAVKF